jgi:phage/plasmid-like protein (TIGR03299 family)
MPADLSSHEGKVEMMYVREEPWHRLGTKLSEPATAAEAIEAAHLGWEVKKVPIYVKTLRRHQQIPNRFGIVRGDQITKSGAPVLGIVGAKYRPLQNRIAFEWFDGIVGAGAAIYHTAGALGHGERVWILAKLPGEIKVVGDDITDKYLLLSNSHDGESSVQVKFTPVRVVCKNTLTMALSQGPTLRISHTPSLHQRMADAKKNLGIIDRRYERMQADFQALAGVRMDRVKLAKYLSLVFPDAKDTEDERAKQRVTECRRACGELFENGRGNKLPGVSGTLWAAYNGIAEYVDFGPTSRSPSQRLESIWFGAGYLTKAKAFKVAVANIAEWRN